MCRDGTCTIHGAGWSPSLGERTSLIRATNVASTSSRFSPCVLEAPPEAARVAAGTYRRDTALPDAKPDIRVRGEAAVRPREAAKRCESASNDDKRVVRVSAGQSPGCASGSGLVGGESACTPETAEPLTGAGSMTDLAVDLRFRLSLFVPGCRPFSASRGPSAAHDLVSSLASSSLSPNVAADFACCDCRLTAALTASCFVAAAC